MKEEDEAIGFFVRLCRDVFLEILFSGNRRQLVKVERVDRRIRRLVENFLGERPFLRLIVRLVINIPLVARPGYFIFGVKICV